MGFAVLGKQVLRCSKKVDSTSLDVPKGYLAVYVGDMQRRFVVPLTFLNQPLFVDLLSKAEDEFGFDHPMGGLTIHCDEETFCGVTSCIM